MLSKTQQAFELRESPKRQFGDPSSPFYTIKRPQQKANRLHGSVGSFKSTLFVGHYNLEISQQINRSTLNDPQTAVWGIRKARKPMCFRKYLNDPQTAVWGIREARKPMCFRKYLNDPQPAVWGIFAFCAKPFVMVNSSCMKMTKSFNFRHDEWMGILAQWNHGGTPTKTETRTCFQDSHSLSDSPLLSAHSR